MVVIVPKFGVISPPEGPLGDQEASGKLFFMRRGSLLATPLLVGWYSICLCSAMPLANTAKGNVGALTSGVLR